MECVRHVLLESETRIFKMKRKFQIRDYSPWVDKSSFLLILYLDMDFIIAKKTIHEGKYRFPYTFIENFVGKRG